MVTPFRKNILSWHQEIDRQLPWKSSKDPYKTWISEIVMQQTRIAYGIGYYNRIVERFPTVQDMASAAQEEILSVWKGLGYYARARNMHAAAQQIVNEHQGIFPHTYDELLQLKGIGPYTAAAIASFCFDLPHAVVDGNVYRVLSRYFGEETPIDTTEGKHLFAALAQECLSKKEPAAYNQAIMDLGALVCKPAVPSCHLCPLQTTCAAHRDGLVDLLPIKLKKVVIKKRYFNYFIFQKEEKVLLQQRVAKDIWQGLYELPLIETEKKLTQKAMKTLAMERFSFIADAKIKKVAEAQQKLSHRLIIGTFYEVQGVNKELIGRWTPKGHLSTTALPKIVDDALRTYI